MKKIIIICSGVAIVAALTTALIFVFFVRPQTQKKYIANNYEPRQGITIKSDIEWDYKLSTRSIKTTSFITEPVHNVFFRAMDDLCGYTTYGNPLRDTLTRLNPERFIASKCTNYKQARSKFVVDGMVVAYKTIFDFLNDVQESTNYPVVTIKNPINEITVPKGSAILFLNKVSKKALENKIASTQMLRDKQADISKDNLSGYHLIKSGDDVYRIKLFYAENNGTVDVNLQYITESGLVWKSVTSVEVR